MISPKFDASSTALDVVAGVDLAGARAIVTGGASGIGIETARALAFAGAEVTLAVRGVAAGGKVADDLNGMCRGLVATAPLELLDLESIRRFADDWASPLDILVCNAGVMATPEGHTPRGHEIQFATNHLGHFALATALHPHIAERGGRVVVVSSTAHLMSPVVFDDIHFRYRPYDPVQAYAQSKTANVLFAVGASRRWSADGITINACNPGAIATGLQRHVGGKLATPPHLQKTPEQGAATSALLASDPDLDGVTGRYFNDCAEATPVDHRPADIPELVRSVAPYALDPENAVRLWAVSEGMLSS